MRFELDGAEVFAHGRVEADAPTIVLIHGAAMDHSVWVYNTRYFLHRGYSVVALDMPGHGASEGELLDSVERMAEWVGRVVEHLGVGPVRVAGHSMGALVALAYAAQAGEAGAGIIACKHFLADADAVIVDDGIEVADSEPVEQRLLQVGLAMNRVPGAWFVGQAKTEHVASDQPVVCG